ncbi:MAG: hypothetical protein IJ491_04450 [Clostridia bacterium]|nr:hypothetical protein [Clostridia bacterium]
MFYEQDWVMRQIKLLVRFIARAVFKKDTAEYKELIEESIAGTDILHRELMLLVSEGRICEAENFLFDNLDKTMRGHLALALDFYERLNNLSDEELEQANFSREEIKDGLNNVLDLFGLDFAREMFS